MQDFMSCSSTDCIAEFVMNSSSHACYMSQSPEDVSNKWRNKVKQAAGLQLYAAPGLLSTSLRA